MNIHNRWFQLVASLIAMIMIANLQYAWTLFVQPLQRGTGWKLSDIQYAFTLFVLFVVSFKVRDGGWRAAGFVRPPSWRRAIVLALAAAALLHAGSELVVQPLAHRLWPEPEHVSSLFEPAMKKRT